MAKKKKKVKAKVTSKVRTGPKRKAKAIRKSDKKKAIRKKIVRKGYYYKIRQRYGTKKAIVSRAKKLKALGKIDHYRTIKLPNGKYGLYTSTKQKAPRKRAAKPKIILCKIKYKGRFLSEKLCRFIENINKQLKKRKINVQLNTIAERLFMLVENKIFGKPITYKNETRDKKIDEVLKLFLLYNDDYYELNSNLSQLQDIYDRDRNAKFYFLGIFETKFLHSHFSEIMARSDIELTYIWDAMERYKEEIDDGISPKFSIYLIYEPYTGIVLVDYTKIKWYGLSDDAITQIEEFIRELKI